MRTTSMTLQLQVVLALAVLAVFGSGEQAQLEPQSFSTSNLITADDDTIHNRQLLQTTRTGFPTPAIAPTDAPTNSPTNTPTYMPTAGPTITPYEFCGQLDLWHYPDTAFNGLYAVVENVQCETKAVFKCISCASDVYTHASGDHWVITTSLENDCSTANMVAQGNGSSSANLLPTVDYGVQWTICDSGDGNTACTGSPVYEADLPDYVGFRPVHRTCYYTGGLTKIEQTEAFNECWSHSDTCTTLDLKGAGLTGTIPTFIGDLTNLVSVQLSANALKGPLPTELGRLTALTSLTLYGTCSAITDPGSSNCAITSGVYDAGSALHSSLPTEIGLLDSLQELIIVGAELTGSLPTEMASLTNLVTINLQDNGLRGDLLFYLDNLATVLPKASHLDLSYNGFWGPLPTELGALTDLTCLKLSHNSKRLSGNIPTEVGALVLLTTLDVSNNPGLGGVIPSTIGNLVALIELKLNSNQLTGTIPVEMLALSVLTELDMHSNLIDGSLPPEVAGLEKLEQLDVSFTALSGAIPSELAALTALTTVNMAHVPAITGTVPAEILGMTILKELKISGVSGTFPDISALTSLETFRLDYATLTGSIPADAFSVLSTLQNVAVIECPGITGELPPKLIVDGAESTLKSIEFVNNSMTGTIPDLYKDYDSLEILDLSHNEFEGQLPSFTSSALKEFDIVGNKLTGSIPGGMPFSSMTDLVEFRISGNRLCGTAPATLPADLLTVVADVSRNVDFANNGNRIGKECPMTWACCSELHQVSTFCCLTSKLEEDDSQQGVIGHFDDDAMWKVCRNSC